MEKHSGQTLKIWLKFGMEITWINTWASFCHGKLHGFRENTEIHAGGAEGVHWFKINNYVSSV